MHIAILPCGKHANFLWLAASKPPAKLTTKGQRIIDASKQKAMGTVPKKRSVKSRTAELKKINTYNIYIQCIAIHERIVNWIDWMRLLPQNHWCTIYKCTQPPPQTLYCIFHFNLFIYCIARLRFATVIQRTHNFRGICVCLHYIWCNGIG